MIWSLTAFMGLMSAFGLGILTLLPAWARDILGGDVTTNGWMISARGLGALVGALALASLGRRGGRGKLWLIGSFMMPLGLAVFSLVRWVPLSLLLLFGVGLGLIFVANNSNAMVQSLVDDRLRGRVMGIYTLVFFGAMPIGSFLAGTLAVGWGEPLTVLVSAGIMFLLAIGAALFFPEIRRQD